MKFQIGQNCVIHPSVVINVESGFIGAGSVINEGVRIEGTRVEIGREAFIDRFATVGGGSCYDPGAFLMAGDWLHMGQNSQINIARGVNVGHELGCGIETKIFTHGAYLDSYNLGAPAQWEGVTIGDSVWLPNAWINPGVNIGHNVIVSARSLINRDIPSGSLAGGTPCRVIKENYLPKSKTLFDRSQLISSVFDRAILRLQKKCPSAKGSLDFFPEQDQAITYFRGQSTSFRFRDKILEGAVNELSVLFKDQLRRNGIRFRYSADGQNWKKWGTSPLSLL